MTEEQVLAAAYWLRVREGALGWFTELNKDPKKYTHLHVEFEFTNESGDEAQGWSADSRMRLSLSSKAHEEMLDALIDKANEELKTLGVTP